MSKDIFAEAAAGRQRLLDYIKQHGECVHVQLARFSGDTPGNVMRKMRLMEANGEVRVQTMGPGLPADWKAKAEQDVVAEAGRWV